MGLIVIAEQCSYQPSSISRWHLVKIRITPLPDDFDSPSTNSSSSWTWLVKAKYNAELVFYYRRIYRLKALLTNFLQLVPRGSQVNLFVVPGFLFMRHPNAFCTQKAFFFRKAVSVTSGKLLPPSKSCFISAQIHHFTLECLKNLPVLQARFFLFCE